MVLFYQLLYKIYRQTTTSIMNKAIILESEHINGRGVQIEDAHTIEDAHAKHLKAPIVDLTEK